jgi:type IV secretion system protein VirB10
MSLRPQVALLFAAALGSAQPPAPVAAAEYTLPPGTRVPLSLINTISTKHSLPGDRVYLETAFPVMGGGRILIPVGSYVAGTVTRVKKPGRVKGRGELYVRFDSLTLPNGVTRDFRARLGGVDASASGDLDKSEGVVKSEGNKAGDARMVGEAAGAGASVGVIASRTAMGAGIGAAAGAAAGLIGVLATRGPDAILPRGSTVEMVLDRTLSFQNGELNFAGAPAAAPVPPPPGP